jgi:hypothetical protein
VIDTIGAQRHVSGLGREHELHISGDHLLGARADRVQNRLLGRMRATRHHMLRVLLDELLQASRKSGLLDMQALDLANVRVHDGGVLFDELGVVDFGDVADGHVAVLLDWLGLFHSVHYVHDGHVARDRSLLQLLYDHGLLTELLAQVRDHRLELFEFLSTLLELVVGAHVACVGATLDRHVPSAQVKRVAADRTKYLWFFGRRRKKVYKL